MNLLKEKEENKMFKMETDPESSAEINEFILGWTNPKMQLPIFFNELLQRKELIDVTLSAEGRFFGAHRLILSAYSPYFRQLFAQIPSDQNAYGESTLKINFKLPVFLFFINKKKTKTPPPFVYSGASQRVGIDPERSDYIYLLR